MIGLNRIVRLADFFYVLSSSSSIKSDLDEILNQIENLETFQERQEFAESNLNHLSSGSSRIVYKTDDNFIIKMAKNKKGIAQNKAEANPEMISDFLNKILDKASNYSWIKTCYLDKITAKDFEKMTGINFDDFSEVIDYGLKNISDSDTSKPKNFNEVSKSKIYKEIKRIGDKFKLMPGDIGRISSWGMKNNHPILIDAGLTKKIFEEFYEDDTKSKNTKSTGKGKS